MLCITCPGCMQRSPCTNHTISRSQVPHQNCQIGTNLHSSPASEITSSHVLDACRSTHGLPGTADGLTSPLLQLRQVPVSLPARSEPASPAPAPVTVSFTPAPSESRPTGLKAPPGQRRNQASALHPKALPEPRRPAPSCPVLKKPPRRGPSAAAAHRAVQCSEGLHDGVQVARVAAAHRAVQRLRQQARHAARGPVAAAVVAAAVVAAAVRRACRAHAHQGFCC